MPTLINIEFFVFFFFFCNIKIHMYELQDGRLTAGDQLLKVDGQSLVGITQEK